MEERLRKFLYLADAGSFTKASRQLHISQPALSAAMQKLERELNAELYVRMSRPLRLTEAGILAYAAARQLAAHTGSLKAQLAALSHEPISVTLGMIDSVAGLAFTDARNLQRLEHQANVSVVVNNSRYLTHAVANSEVDLAFVVERQGHASSGVTATFIGSEPMVLVCHPGLQKDTEGAIAEGRVPHFISYDQQSTSHGLIREGLYAHGLEVEPVFFSTSPDVMLRLVLLRKGAAVLPYLLVQDLIDRSELVWLSKDGPLLIERRIQSVIANDRKLTPPLEQSVTLIRQLLENQCHVASST